LAVAQNPVFRTDQSPAKLAAAIVNGYKSRCKMGPGRRARADTAIDRELRYSVFKSAQGFSSSMVAVGRRQMTGNLTDKNLIRMATAHFDAENSYEAVQVDDNDEDAPVLVVKEGGTRGADWAKCWTVMRKLDKLSGASGAAATAAAARGRHPVPDGGVEDILDDDSSSTVGRLRGLFQERPIGTKALKAAASTDIAIHREAATTAAAFKFLSKTAIERADIDFRQAKDVRETGEAEQWRKNEMERRLLLSNKSLRKAKAAKARLASRSTAMAPSMSGTSAAATAAAEAAAGAAAGRALSAAASPASAVFPSGGAAASPGSGGAPATPGGVALNGCKAAALALAADHTVGSPTFGAAASAAALLPSASSTSGGVDASSRTGASPAAAARAAASRRAAASTGVGSVKWRKERGWYSLQTKQAGSKVDRKTVSGPSRFMTPRPHNAAAGESGDNEEAAACGTSGSDCADGDLARIVSLLTCVTVGSLRVWSARLLHRLLHDNHTRFFFPLLREYVFLHTDSVRPCDSAREASTARSPYLHTSHTAA